MGSTGDPEALPLCYETMGALADGHLTVELSRRLSAVAEADPLPLQLPNEIGQGRGECPPLSSSLVGCSGAGWAVASAVPVEAVSLADALPSVHGAGECPPVSDGNALARSSADAGTTPVSQAVMSHAQMLPIPEMESEEEHVLSAFGSEIVAQAIDLEQHINEVL